ncbi:hypothetical protein CSIRO_0078 [Bradyrhizobiaceae bacterium SG-6C]|nr:hypothetical protein CSIRO_0078 [Bradyrhizobiaceae bacterium SG-6C]
MRRALTSTGSTAPANQPRPFYYDYSDLQVTKVVNNVITTVNAATATIMGLEGEITSWRPTTCASTPTSR